MLVSNNLTEMTRNHTISWGTFLSGRFIKSSVFHSQNDWPLSLLLTHGRGAISGASRLAKKGKE